MRVTLNFTVAQPFPRRSEPRRTECTRLTNNKPAVRSRERKREREAFCRLNTAREKIIYGLTCFSSFSPLSFSFFFFCCAVSAGTGTGVACRVGASLLAILVTLDVRFNGCCLFLLSLFGQRFLSFFFSYFSFSILAFFVVSRGGKIAARVNRLVAR